MLTIRFSFRRGNLGSAAERRAEPLQRSPPGPIASRRGLAGRVLLLLLTICAAVFLLPRHAHAVNRTWTGAGATTNWSEAANWSGGVVPGAADVAVFDGTSVKDAAINVN